MCHEKGRWNSTSFRLFGSLGEIRCNGTREPIAYADSQPGKSSGINTYSWFDTTQFVLGRVRRLQEKSLRSTSRCFAINPAEILDAVDLIRSSYSKQPFLARRTIRCIRSVTISPTVALLRAAFRFKLGSAHKVSVQRKDSFSILARFVGQPNLMRLLPFCGNLQCYRRLWQRIPTASRAVGEPLPTTCCEQP